MDVERRMELITSEPIEEVVTREELRRLLEANERIYAYDGFEPSGLAHIGSAILRALKIGDILKAGVRFKILVADYFAYMNDKLGGDMERIRKAGLYLIEAWKACGIDTNKVDIVWASELMEKKDYFKDVIKVMKITTIKRLIRCSPAMGRKTGEMLYGSSLLYPAMQAVDPFHLGVEICQLGMDQRHVTMLSREVANKLGYSKPVCMHHHLLPGLQARERMGRFEGKMSKSKPSSAIYIHDSREEIKRKVHAAYCKERDVEMNPVLEIARYIIFKKFKRLEVEREKRFGGDVIYESYDELERDFSKGDLHPLDLKNAVAEKLEEVISPIRAYFERNRRARELYEAVKSFGVSR